MVAAYERKQEPPSKRRKEADKLREETKQREDHQVANKLAKDKARKDETRAKKQQVKAITSAPLRRFIREKFNGVTSLELSIPQTTNASPNSKHVTRHMSELQVFGAVIPPVAWEHLSTHTTIEMKRKVSTGEVTGSYAHQYYKEKTVEEIKEAVALRMAMSQFKEDNIETRLSKLSPNIGIYLILLHHQPSLLLLFVVVCCCLLLFVVVSVVAMVV